MALWRSMNCCGQFCQDEPLKMRRLAEIFHVDVASLHELWMLCGADAGEVEERMEQDLALARTSVRIPLWARSMRDSRSCA